MPPVESPSIAPLLLSEREAQQALAVGYQSLRALRDAGRIKAVRIGTRVLYPVAELQRFIQQAQGGGRRAMKDDNSPVKAKPVVLSNGLAIKQNILLCEINQTFGTYLPAGSRKSIIGVELARMGRCKLKRLNIRGALWVILAPNEPPPINSGF